MSSRRTPPAVVLGEKPSDARASLDPTYGRNDGIVAGPYIAAPVRSLTVVVQAVLTQNGFQVSLIHKSASSPSTLGDSFPPIVPRALAIGALIGVKTTRVPSELNTASASGANSTSRLQGSDIACRLRVRRSPEEWNVNCTTTST